MPAPLLVGLVVRDVLEVDLQSEPHLIFLLVSTGLAFVLILIAVTIFYLSPLWRFVRQLSFSRSPVQNPAVTEMFKPIMSSTPTKKTLILPPRQTLVYHPHPVASQPRGRVPAFFRANNTIQTHPTLSPRPTTIPYYGFGYGLHRFPQYEPQPPPPAAQTLVSPHIAGWMKVADTVVGPHPFAQPLSARVATQAEIDLIGGHVHIPWAFRAKLSQPVPVKVLQPISVPPPIAIYPVPNRNAAGAGSAVSAPSTRAKGVLAALVASRIKLDDPIVTAARTTQPQGNNTPPVGPPGRRNHRLGSHNLI